MVRHYAPMHGFHTLPKMLKTLLERGTVRGFSTYLGAYGSHTLGHSVGPLVLTLFIDK